MNNKEITDHSLHLLVDDQLDPVSKKRLEKEIEASPELQQKLKNITEIKELIGLAYIQEDPQKISSIDQSVTVKASITVALAASLIMAVGLTLGWFAHQQFEGKVLVVASSDSRPQINHSKIPLEINLQNARKYMMHFDSLNEDKLKATLLETRSILESYARSGLPLKIDLLFDQASVHMFKPQHALQIKHLKNLINNYQNIELFACSESIRLFLGKGNHTDDMKLFHTNQVVQEMIPDRLEQGWVYIKA